jgi:hypothetical protein
MLAAALALASAPCLTQGIDPTSAARLFAQLRETSAREGGKTWGRELYGPILLADRVTHRVVADRADAQGLLQASGGVFTGQLPSDRNIANTALDWGGVRWTMVMWPLPELRQLRERLVFHECFHRIQEGLGLPAKDAVNDHLDTKDGRIWLQMEWRALERALRSHDGARKAAMADALLFRAYRRSLFPEGAARETALEMNEGLAEYTGFQISSSDRDELIVRADLALRRARENTSFARSFAYVSGPAYGALLDASPARWREQIAKVGDLGRILEAAYGLAPPKSDAAAARAALARYEGEEIAVLEAAREEERTKELAAARRKFADRPVLVLPLGDGVSYGYDPNDVLGVDAKTTVYRSARLVDAWGILEGEVWTVRDEKGSLVRAQVPAPKAPAARPLAGDGWTLDLKDGWELRAGPRAGDLELAPRRTP